jgi:hypothetical protein
VRSAEVCHRSNLIIKSPDTWVNSSPKSKICAA